MEASSSMVSKHWVSLSECRLQPTRGAEWWRWASHKGSGGYHYQVEWVEQHRGGGEKGREGGGGGKRGRKRKRKKAQRRKGKTEE